MNVAQMRSAESTLVVEQVWTEYQPSLKSFLHSKVSNHADVDDLLQDILVKTYHKLSSVKNSDSVKAWLFQVANRTVIDFYRQRAREQHGGELDDKDLRFEQTNVNLEHELAQCVRPLINALPQQQSQLLQAVELNGESQKSVAEKTGLSYSTLKSRVQKGRLELRKRFEDCCTFQRDTRGNLLDFAKKSDGCNHC